LSALVGSHPVLEHRARADVRGLGSRVWVTAGLLAGTVWVGLGELLRPLRRPWL